jgi:hypothetical protein
MNIKEINQKYGRHTLIITGLLIWVYIIWSFFFNGYTATWRQWNIPTEMPPFTDFRLIPSGAETFRSGIDPAVSNPSDPMEHIFNYPKIWYLLFYTGVTQADTIWMSVVLIALFFLTVFVFPEKLHAMDALLILLVAFSPAAMLLYERGNVDLAFFVLCGLAVILVSRSPAWAVVVLSLASMFKLFPFFGVGIFFQENKNRFYRYLFASILIFGIYVVLSFDSLNVAWNLTQRGKVLSYGDSIIFELFHRSLHYRLLKVMAQNQVVTFLNILPHFCAGLVFVAAFFGGLKSRELPGSDSERNLTAFRMGACIYIGTFLLGNNWDYRLAFLIFTVPQISRWISSAGSGQRWPVLGIFIALLVSCWSLVIHTYFLQAVGESYDFHFSVFDELMNWALFAGLIYLLVASAPAWFRSFSWIPSWREIWKDKEI